MKNVDKPSKLKKLARKLESEGGVGLLVSGGSDAYGKVEKTTNGLRFTNVDVRAKVSLGSAGSTERIRGIAQFEFLCKMKKDQHKTTVYRRN